MTMTMTTRDGEGDGTATTTERSREGHGHGSRTDAGGWGALRPALRPTGRTLRGRLARGAAVAAGVALLGAQVPGVAYVLELDGEVVGEFAAMELGREGAVSLRLSDGSTVGGALERWWEQLEPDSPLTVGDNRRSGTACEGRTVVASQRFGHGRRTRRLSHTLVDACPVAWDVEELRDGETDTRSLTFSGTGLGVER